MRIAVVLILALGLATSVAGAASAQNLRGTEPSDVHHQLTTDDLVEQLIQMLKDILNDILSGGGDSLADLLPEECSVTATGFACDFSGGIDPDFSDHVDCAPTIVATFPCTVGGLEYPCSTDIDTNILTCTTPMV